MTFDEITIQDLAVLIAKGDQMFKCWPRGIDELPRAIEIHDIMKQKWEERTGEKWNGQTAMF
jgi:hypothetical protein